MKEVMEKVDATMRLLLLGMLLVSWMVFAVEADPVEVGVQLYLRAKSIPETNRPDEVREFLKKSERGPSLAPVASGIRERIQRLQVFDDCLSLRFAQPPLDLKEARRRGLERLKLLSDAANGNTESDQTLAKELKVFLESDPFQFRESVETLQRLWQKSGATNDLSLEELRKKVEPEIQMPFVDIQIGAYSSAKVIATGLVVFMLYLLSLFSVIENQLRGKAKHTEGSEWVFFHPSQLGAVLGVLWIATPGLVFFGGGFLHTESRVFYFSVGASLLVVAGFLIAKALTLRKNWEKQFR